MSVGPILLELAARLELVTPPAVALLFALAVLAIRAGLEALE